MQPAPPRLECRCWTPLLEALHRPLEEPISLDTSCPHLLSAPLLKPRDLPSMTLIPGAMLPRLPGTPKPASPLPSSSLASPLECLQLLHHPGHVCHLCCPSEPLPLKPVSHLELPTWYVHLSTLWVPPLRMAQTSLNPLRAVGPAPVPMCLDSPPAAMRQADYPLVPPSNDPSLGPLNQGVPKVTLSACFLLMRWV